MGIKTEKTKTKWVCQNCGYETSKYLGKCPDCGQWGTLLEETEVLTKAQTSVTALRDEKPSLIDEIEIDSSIRFSTGLEEFDRVLGGGLVQGSLTLLAGDPGIGKSTLLLQAGCNISQQKKLMYVTAEESSSQVKLRAKRLKVTSDNLFIYAQNNFELIKKHILELQPEIVVVDSIQAIYSNDVMSTAGSVSQIRECTNLLMDLSKSHNVTIIIVGHVTKDGNIAGPKVLEHMVDSVIYFEGDKYKSYRLLRCMKNRFGTTNEVGLFNMSDGGLEQVKNPSELFLNLKNETNMSGSVVIATNEGTRPLLVEIQALVGTTAYPSGRRVANGVDFSRMLQIIAVLEKRLGLNLSKQDVYANVIGGIDINEPAADLGIALSIITCARDVVVDFDTVIVGEIGLSGEIRPVNNIEKRIMEAEKLGFKKIVIPNQLKKNQKFKNIEVVQVKRLIDAINVCVKKDKTFKLH